MVRLWRRDRIGSEADRATFRTLHTAALAGPPLRNGLTKTSAERAIKHLRSLLGAPAIAITDTVGLLAWDGKGQHHDLQAVSFIDRATSGVSVIDARDLRCAASGCEVRRGLVTPLVVEDRLVGTLQTPTRLCCAPPRRSATGCLGSWIWPNSTPRAPG